MHSIKEEEENSTTPLIIHSDIEGVVSWFSNSKGYGFITSPNLENPNNEKGDFFAHYSEIVATGYKTLKQGDSVIFDITQGRKGLQASNIRVK